jgi:hypothetical protein
MGTFLNHTDDLATIHESIQALCADLSINTLSGNKLVPPPKQKVTSDELEPRRKDVSGVIQSRVSQAALDR